MNVNLMQAARDWWLDLPLPRIISGCGRRPGHVRFSAAARPLRQRNLLVSDFGCVKNLPPPPLSLI